MTSAARRASSVSSTEQQRFLPSGASGSSRVLSRIVMPMTSYPSRASSPAATAESTPPLIATTTRCRFVIAAVLAPVASSSRFASQPLVQHLRLKRRRFASAEAHGAD